MHTLDISVSYHERRGRITDVGLAMLRNLPLTSLSLGGRDLITDAGLEVLRGKPLTSLSLFCCRNVTGAGFGVLDGMLLTSIELHGVSNRVTVDEIQVLRQFTGLVSLSLCSVPSEVAVPLLSGLPLTKLHATRCGFSDEDLEVLRHMPLTDLAMACSSVS